MKVNRLFISFALLLMPFRLFADDVTVVVTNDEEVQRQELISIDVEKVRQKLGISSQELFVVRNSLSQQVDYQVTHDGKLLIDAAVRPCGKTTFTISRGIPDPMRKWVEGKVYPLRKDDLGWENDRGTYRIYGPALQKSGEKSYGIDVWTKNSKELDMSERYYKDLEGGITGWANAKDGKKDPDIHNHTSFHLDHGNGLDCYGVGPTLGCGAPALMVGEELIMPYSYQTYKILDNGPLRFTVELTYTPKQVKNDAQVVEHRIISLDKGSNFNKMTVWYEGLSAPCDMAAGVVIHSADKESVVIGKNFVQYADPTDKPEHHGFQLYVAALFPNGAQTRKLMYAQPSGGNEGHAVGIKRGLKNNERYTYYFGSAWSEYDVRSQAEWQVRINWFMRALERPLLVEIK